jgi:hypothetical protein
MARPRRGCKGFLHRVARESGRRSTTAGAFPARGWHLPAIAAILCAVAASADPSVGAVVIIEFPTPAMENRVAPVLFMLTMAVDYL